MENITRWSGYRSDVDECVKSTVHAIEFGVTLCGVVPRTTFREGGNAESYWEKSGWQVTCEKCRKAMQRRGCDHKHSV
jgi:hypothetical protein